MFLLMPACSRDRLDVALHEIVRPVGLFAPHGLAGKDVIVIHWIGALPAPAQQVFCQMAIQWYRLRRCLGLAVADHLMPDGPRHIELKFVEIHILPSKHQEFADAETCGRVEQGEGPLTDRQLAQEKLNLLKFQNVRDALSLRALPHELDRILIRPLVAHRVM